jgi:hypothetical protein
MTASLCVESRSQLSRVTTRATIGQECDWNVIFVSDAVPHRADDGDLVLLDDAGIGHEATAEIRSIRAQTA